MHAWTGGWERGKDYDLIAGGLVKKVHRAVDESSKHKSKL